MAPLGELWKKSTQPKASCPDIETLVSYREGSLPGHIQDHIRTCARCSAELELLEKFFDSTESTAEKEEIDWIVNELQRREIAFSGQKQEQPRRGLAQEKFRTRWASWALPLAAAFVLAFVGLNVFQNWFGQDLAYEPPTQPGVTRSTEVTGISPSGSIESPPQVVTWEGIQSATSYLVTLRAVDNSELWQGRTPTNNIQLPAEVQELFLPGRSLFLEVRGFDQGNREVARSPRSVIEVQKPE